jgi:GNAT superfamily N-acetyltransferase
MLAWAEANLMVTEDNGTRWLWIWAYDWDTERGETLRQRGYQPEENAFYMQRRRFLSEPLPAPDVANGYTIRSVTPDESDVVRWVETTNRVFNNHYPADMHRNFQLHSPSHNYDIHTVAVAEDGTFAAFSGLTIDETNRTATFEPVGTHPDHRRKGLAREVMYEGIRRLQQLGTVDVVYVGSWGPSPAGKFYEDVGLAHYATHRAWKLELTSTSAL